GHTSPVMFFFQAEDGIRDRNVTGVQTCALPISADSRRQPFRMREVTFEAEADRMVATTDQLVDAVGKTRRPQSPRAALANYRKEIGRASCRERVTTTAQSGRWRN